jgi:hypothetical protein
MEINLLELGDNFDWLMCLKRQRGELKIGVV